MKRGPKPLDFKYCSSCELTKARTEFYKKLNSVSFYCKICTIQRNKSNAPKYFGKYSEYQNEWRRKNYQSNPTYKTKVVEQKKSFYNANKDTLNANRRDRWAYDPFNPARLHYRRKDVKFRTPPWVNKAELLAFYAKCPSGMEVDHVIPLKGLIDGRAVSGLHVPWNLQYLTKEQNRKKHCRISELDL
jgi:hypothetical protein